MTDISMEQAEGDLVAFDKGGKGRGMHGMKGGQSLTVSPPDGAVTWAVTRGTCQIHYISFFARDQKIVTET